jgi:uncharacterized protein (DUF302 family)
MTLRSAFRTWILAALTIILANLTGEPAMATDGLTTIKSQFDAAETMDRLEAAVSERGARIFARIDHAAGAAETGLLLRPTMVLIFGNPKGGTPVMQSSQTAGIDLPLKALVWQDAAGDTWLSYNDPAWIARRHAAGHDADPAVSAMSVLLRAVATSVTTGSAAN